MIKGITVILYDETITGTDGFDQPVYALTAVNVENCLVSPSNDDEILSSTELYGRRAEFTIGIPKGDTHNWENKKVEFLGKTYQTFGPVIQGIEANVPTKWHKKVMCGRYD